MLNAEKELFKNGTNAKSTEIKKRGFVQCFAFDLSIAKTPVILNRGRYIETDDHLELESGKKLG